MDAFFYSRSYYDVVEDKRMLVIKFCVAEDVIIFLIFIFSYFSFVYDFNRISRFFNSLFFALWLKMKNIISVVSIP